VRGERIVICGGQGAVLVESLPGRCLHGVRTIRGCAFRCARRCPVSSRVRAVTPNSSIE
jgi:hypothetical protein